MTDLLQRLRVMARLINREDDADTAAEAAREIARLREAIRRLADQDGTLSVQGDNVMVTMDATLTDGEREAIEWVENMAAWAHNSDHVHAATLRGLLDRTKETK